MMQRDRERAINCLSKPVPKCITGQADPRSPLSMHKEKIQKVSRIEQGSVKTSSTFRKMLLERIPSPDLLSSN